MQTIGTVQKGKMRLAGMKLEQEELSRKVARELAEQHKRMGRLAEAAGLFDVDVDDDVLRKAFSEIAARFRNQGASAASAGAAAEDLAAAAGPRAKGKNRDVQVLTQG
jgi:hypothetical protein